MVSTAHDGQGVRGRARSPDELGFDPDVPGALAQFSFQPADGEFDGVQRKHVDRLPDRRQRRRHEFGPGIVVEHDEAQIVRYSDRGLLDPAQDVAT
jgi:hypothetical protein